MHLQSEIRRLISLVLTLSFLLWVMGRPAASAFSQYASSCHGGTMHLQPASTSGAQTSAHHCCPQHASPSVVLEEQTNAACQQSCCKLRQQPLQGAAYLASDDRQTSYSGLPANNTYGTPTATFDVAVVTSAPIHKAVFELKADLRI
jgi:hypothetical protein